MGIDVRVAVLHRPVLMPPNAMILIGLLANAGLLLARCAVRELGAATVTEHEC